MSLKNGPPLVREKSSRFNDNDLSTNCLRANRSHDFQDMRYSFRRSRLTRSPCGKAPAVHISHLKPETLAHPSSIGTLRFQPAFAHGLHEDLVVALVLISIGLGEVGDGFVEYVALAKVSAYLCGLAGACVRMRERPSAQFGILHHDTAGKSFDQHADLHVLQLPDITVPAFRTHRPAKGDVAGRLHETVPIHHPLAMVGIHAFSSISLQDRGPRFFHLEEKRIPFASQKEQDSTPGADAADADH